MSTYTQTKAVLDEIAERSEANRKRKLQAVSLLQQAQADLNAMGEYYSSFATQLATDAQNNPSDPAWQAAKAEIDLMVIDFVALKTEVDALVTAVS